MYYFVIQHVMLVIRFLISCAIPDKPDWVATEMAKVEFARREAVNRLSSTTTTPPSSTTVVTIPAKSHSTFYEMKERNNDDRSVFVILCTEVIV